MSAKLLKVSDIRADLGVTDSRVRQMIAEGVLPAVRLGPRSIRIPAAAWEQWLAEQSSLALAAVERAEAE